MPKAQPNRVVKMYQQHREWTVLSAALLVLFVSIAIAKLGGGQQDFPQAISNNFPFAEWVNAGEQWLKDNLRWLTKAIAGGIGVTLNTVETFLILLSWPLPIVAIALLALRTGGLRLALFCIAACLFWAMMDMWDPAMETLSLMAIAVVISVILGVTLGIITSQSDRIEAVVRPILDTMQTMPSFVYLIPAIFFFGIGGPPAVMATVIYALPPAVRLTNLGIRQVSPEIIEATRSFGSTNMQLLFKVKLPMALPSIMMGINQTVMMALGLVVIATFIGARGLGYEVWQALRHLNVGWSLEGGLSIVLMAVMFDRISYAMSGHDRRDRLPGEFRLLPKRLEQNPIAIAIEHGLEGLYRFCRWVADNLANAVALIAGLLMRFIKRSAAADTMAVIRGSGFLLTSIAILAGVYLYDAHINSFGSFPRDWQFSIREPIDAALDWLKVNASFTAITTWIRWFVFVWMLDPLSDFLVELPWWYTIALVTATVWMTAGRWLALICIVAMMFIGAVGMWEITMETLATILVAVALCFVIGVPLGILAAISDTFEAILKPVLDAMQTMPAFVYLIPVLMFFGGNVVSAVIATLVYAIPPTIRLTTLGIRGVPHQAVEAATSFGSTFTQIMLKVRVPLALPSIMMGINQAVMMALAMTVLTPLIGGGGLGQQVFNALAVVNTGKGLAAGLSIVFVAIVLDRLTQAWSINQQKALGVQ